MFSHRARGTIQIKSMDTEKTRALCRCFTPRCLMARSEEHTSELQSRLHLVCRLLLEKKKKFRRKPGNLRDQLTRAACPGCVSRTRPGRSRPRCGSGRDSSAALECPDSRSRTLSILCT